MAPEDPDDAAPESPRVNDRGDATIAHEESEERPFDGDPVWRVNRRLRDGTPVTVRPVVPEDREALRRGFLELSPESRYFRFLNLSSAPPSEELLTYLTSVDQINHVAIGALVASPDLKSERGVGIARFVRLKGSEDIAEAAVTVADDMQRKGVGGVLLHELLRAAQAHHVKTLRAEVLANNETMRGILERAGAHKVLEESGAGTIAYDIPITETIQRVERDEPEPSDDKATLFDVLRTAAETMALRFRRE